MREGCWHSLSCWDFVIVLIQLPYEINKFFYRPGIYDFPRATAGDARIEGCFGTLHITRQRKRS